MISKQETKILCSLVGACGYNSGNKAAFKRLSMKLLRDLRNRLNMPEAELHYNAGGIAVSGDASLHSDNVHVFFNADGICGLGIAYRTCKGKRDYTGGRNNFFNFERLESEGVEGLANAVGSLIGGVCQ